MSDDLKIIAQSSLKRQNVKVSFLRIVAKIRNCFKWLIPNEGELWNSFRNVCTVHHVMLSNISQSTRISDSDHTYITDKAQQLVNPLGKKKLLGFHKL